jgi:hypothetical protein
VVEREVASNDAFCLPCSWAPLQSMTAAASRRIPVPGRVGGVVRGARTPAKRFGVLRIRHWTRDPRVLVPGALVGVASELDTRPELTGLFEEGVIRGWSTDRGPRSSCRLARRRGDGRMAVRLELRDSVTEVMESRVLRVVGHSRSGERRGGALRGSFLATWPPKWLGRSGGQLTVAFHRSGVQV